MCHEQCVGDEGIEVDDGLSVVEGVTKSSKLNRRF